MKKQQYTINANEKRRAVRAMRKYTGRDATRLARLRPDEIADLRSQIEPDVPEGTSILVRTEAPLHRLKQAQNQHLRVHLRKGALRSDWTDTYMMFNACGIVLAAAGVFATDKTDEVSHLCGNWRCCRKEHLCYESHDLNMKRVGCPGAVTCVRCDCWTNACPHTPRCIKRTVLGNK